MRLFLFPFILFFFTYSAPCLGQFKYQRQMTRNLPSAGESDGVLSHRGRYGFRFQSPEEYPYKKVQKVGPNLFIAQQENRRWGMIDSLNQERIAFDNALLTRYVHGDYFVVSWEGKMGVLDTGLKYRYSRKYEDLQCYKVKPCLAKLNGKWGVVHPGDEIVVPFEFEDITYSKGGGYQVKSGGKWGLVDSAGQEIVPAVYDEVVRTSFRHHQLLRSGQAYFLYDLRDGTGEQLNIDEAIVNNQTWRGIIKKENRFGVVVPGQKQLDFPFDEVTLLVNVDESYIYRIRGEEGYGIFHTSNGLITQQTYDQVEVAPCTRGSSPAFVLYNEQGVQLIDGEGNIKVAFSQGQIATVPESWRGGVFIHVDQDTVRRVLDCSGNAYLSGAITQIRAMTDQDHLLLFEEAGLWSLFDPQTGNYLVREANEVKSIYVGYLGVRKGVKWRVLRRSTGALSRTAYDWLPEANYSSRGRIYRSHEVLVGTQINVDEEGRMVVKRVPLDSLGEPMTTELWDAVVPSGDSTLALYLDRDAVQFKYDRRIFVDTMRTPRSQKFRHKFVSVNPRNMPVGPTPQPVEIGTTMQVNEVPYYFSEKGWKLVEISGKKVQLDDGVTALDRKLVSGMIRSAFVHYFWRDSLVGLMKNTGEILVPAEFDDIVRIRQLPGQNRLFNAAKRNGRYALMNAEGKVITPFKYDEIRAFQEGMARVRIDQAWGFVDMEGKEVIPVEFESVEPFQFGLSRVLKRGKAYYINIDGMCRFLCD